MGQEVGPAAGVALEGAASVIAGASGRPQRQSQHHREYTETKAHGTLPENLAHIEELQSAFSTNLCRRSMNLCRGSMRINADLRRRKTFLWSTATRHRKSRENL